MSSPVLAVPGPFLVILQKFVKQNHWKRKKGAMQPMMLKRPGMRASPMMLAIVVDSSAFSLHSFYTSEG